MKELILSLILSTAPEGQPPEVVFAEIPQGEAIKAMQYTETGDRLYLVDVSQIKSGNIPQIKRFLKKV